MCHGTSSVRRILCKSHICVATLVICLWCQISLFFFSPQISWLHYQKGCDSCLLSTLLMAQTICFRGSAFVLSPRSKLFVWSPWFVLIIKFYQDNLLVSSQYSLPQTCSQWFLPGKAYYHNLRKTLVMTSTSVKVNRSQEAPQDKKCSLFIYLSIYLSISEGWTNQWDNFSVTLSFMLTQSSDIKICLLCGHEFQRSYIFLTNRYV